MKKRTSSQPPANPRSMCGIVGHEPATGKQRFVRRAEAQPRAQVEDFQKRQRTRSIFEDLPGLLRRTTNK